MNLFQYQLYEKFNLEPLPHHVLRITRTKNANRRYAWSSLGCAVFGMAWSLPAGIAGFRTLVHIRDITSETWQFEIPAIVIGLLCPLLFWVSCAALKVAMEAFFGSEEWHISTNRFEETHKLCGYKWGKTYSDCILKIKITEDSNEGLPHRTYYRYSLAIEGTSGNWRTRALRPLYGGTEDLVYDLASNIAQYTGWEIVEDDRT